MNGKNGHQMPKVGLLGKEFARTAMVVTAEAEAKKGEEGDLGKLIKNLLSPRMDPKVVKYLLCGERKTSSIK